jgi:hypothetical protein
MIENPRFAAALEDALAERARNRRRPLGPVLAWILISVVLPLLMFGVYASYFTILVFFWIQRRGRGHRLILWLRPFHKAETHPAKFGRTLVRACAWWGVPLTIQDSTFRTSVTWALSRAFPYTLPAFWVLILPVFLYTYLPEALTTFITHPYWWFLAWSLAWVVGVSILVRRAGYAQIPAVSAAQTTRALLSRMRAGKGWFNGVSVLQCGDHFWRSTVTIGIESADVVVVDVTHLSDNVIWELQEAVHLVGSSAIILTCFTDGDQFPEQIEGQLTQLFSPEVCVAFGRCAYPRRRLSVQLRAAIGRCLAAQRLRCHGNGIASREAYESALKLAKTRFHKTYGDQYGLENDVFFDFRAAEIALDDAFLLGRPVDINQLCVEAAAVDRAVPREVVEDFICYIRGEL